MGSPSGPPVTPFPKPQPQPCVPKPVKPVPVSGYAVPRGDDGPTEADVIEYQKREKGKHGH